MTPEKLEAHRVRFEELWLKNTGFETQKDEKGYYYDDQQAAWFAYQWGLADADRAQRAAQPPQQNAQPVAWIPNGWQLVPIKPDQQMCQEGHWKAREWPEFPLRISSIYQAMLAVAPKITQTQPVEVQPLTNEFLRDNGVMVHGDGNVFFTNVQQLNRVLGIKPTSSEGGAS